MCNQLPELVERLITARTDADMSQRELADELGVSQTYLALVERGKRRWPAERLHKAISICESRYPDVQHTPEERATYQQQMQDIIDRLNREGWEPGR